MAISKPTPKIGLIFLIPGHNQTVRVNGKARVINNSDLADVKLEVHNPDEKAEVLQGLLLDVEESYSHCPRALKFSKLWDVEEISKNIADPPKSPAFSKGPENPIAPLRAGCLYPAAIPLLNLI